MKMHQSMIKLLTLSLVLGVSQIGLAQTVSSASTAVFGAQQVAPSPIPVLQNLSDQMIRALQKNKASMAKDPNVVYGIVRRILLPKADLEAMARSALSRDAWVSANKAQQQAFIEAFTN